MPAKRLLAACVEGVAVCDARLPCGCIRIGDVEYAYSAVGENQVLQHRAHGVAANDARAVA